MGGGFVFRFRRPVKRVRLSKNRDFDSAKSELCNYYAYFNSNSLVIGRIGFEHLPCEHDKEIHNVPNVSEI